MSSFAELGLAPELLRALADCGYDTPTPIQRQAIPAVLSGRDLLAAAQTGTGKTAGFTLPLLQRLGTPPAGARRIRALILTPTRELAAQVEDSVVTYGKHLKLRSLVMFGGVNIKPQIAALRAGVDILVATPGRLLDHLGQGTVDLKQVEILVLDEADRMLDMGFIRDIRRVLAVLPPKRQNLLFSATFSPDIKALAQGLMQDPALVEVARQNATADTISQRIYPVDRDQKRPVLEKLIREGDWHQVLVFTRTKHGANRLAEQLDKNGISALAIHGNKSQSARERALGEFKAGSLRVLVATDIAARGIDIDALPHVVNYELPQVPEDYVHRIGRTGRAGSTGEAVSLVCVDEFKLLADIEKLIKHKLPQTVLPGFEPDLSVAPEPLRKPRPPRDGAGRNGGERRDGGRGGERNAGGRQTPAKPGTAQKPSTGGAGSTPAKPRPPGGGKPAGQAPAARPAQRRRRPATAKPA